MLVAGGLDDARIHLVGPWCLHGGRLVTVECDALRSAVRRRVGRSVSTEGTIWRVLLRRVCKTRIADQRSRH